MKLINLLLLVLAFVFLVIGIDQAMVLGFADAYWTFMLSLMLLFLYKYQTNKGKATPKVDGGKKVKTRKKNG